MKKYQIIKDNVNVYNTKDGSFIRTLNSGDTVTISKTWKFMTSIGMGEAAQISENEYIILQIKESAAIEIKEKKKKEAKS